MNKSEYPLVSIITVNFNSSTVTDELLQSLNKVTYPSIEVIVVDNGSSLEDASWLKEKHSKIHYLASEKNLGFAGGNNLGILSSKGEYLLFLNNDTEVDPGFIQPLVKAFANPKIGMVSPMIKYYNTNVIQYAGNGTINILTGRSERVGYHESDEGQFSVDTPTGSVHGAAMMISRAVLNKIGHIPELYFLYYEEIDWSEIVKKNGFEIWFIHNSIIYHKESMSIGKSSVTKTYYMNRSRLIYMRRNTRGASKLIWILFYIIFTIPKNSIVFLINTEFGHLKAFWKAIMWNIKHTQLK